MSSSSTTSNDGMLYKQLAQLPSYRAAHFQGGDSTIVRATISALDFARNKKRQSNQIFFVPKGPGSDGVVNTLPAQDSPDVVASAAAPSGRYHAILRETSDEAGPGGKKRFVEVWSAHGLVACADVSSVHGAFYNDEYLSSISFSPSESRVVYTAEQNTVGSSGGEADANVDTDGSDGLEKYRFTPGFGEAYAGKKKPGVFLFEWAGGRKPSITQLALADGEGPGDAVLLGHPVFAAEDKVVAVGYEYAQDGRMLGVIHCPNRPAALWELTLPSLHDLGDRVTPCVGARLTDPSRSCRSPRVLRRTGRSDLLVWLSNEVSGPHASSVTLHTRDLTTGDERVVVEPVWDPQTSADFPGLYVTTLTPSPFVELTGAAPASQETSWFVAVSSIWGSRGTVVLVSLDDGTVAELTREEDAGGCSWSVLCTDGQNKIVCTRSAPSRPPELVLGSIDNSRRAEWQALALPDLSEDLCEKLNSLATSIERVPDRRPTEIVLIRPRNGWTKGTPCITVVHGGPHSTSTTAFNAWATAFALEGYTIAMPNYTGSLGFGEKHVRGLLGHVGSLDVEDCMASVHHLVSSGISSYGPGQQFLYGGSHGGFLLGHLIGQHPATFSGAVLRNPVVSMGEISTSDIPDWYYEEAGFSFAATSLVTPPLYEKLFRMSPIAHVDAIEAPVVILLGEKDQRVAPTQGRNYYHALKARGKDVELLCLKDDMHALDSVEGQWVSYEAARRLFESRRSKAI